MKKLNIEDAAYSNLLAYAKLQMHTYEFAKHNILIAKSLMRLESDPEFNRLCIFCPPRSGKTMMAANFFVSWFMGRNPEKEVMYTSYSHERSSDVGKEIRNTMVDPLYNQIFPDCQVRVDSKSSTHLTTNRGGQFYAVGIGGALTGRGAHLLVMDDVIKDDEQARSESYRNRIEGWFSKVAYTRLYPGNKIILIMTRWRYDDIGYYLTENKKHENWNVINLPAIAEEDNDQIGRKAGEALWPERYPIEDLENIRETIGTAAFNSLYQQRPAPEGGGMIQLDWFGRFNLKDDIIFKKIVLSADTAQKETELHDPTAITVWGETDTDYYLINVYNKRWGYPKLKKNIVKIWEKYNKLHPASVPLLIEDKGSGTSLIQDLKNETFIPVIATKAVKSKEIRMSEVTAIMESGRVWLPEKARWLYEVETQLSRFPTWKFDDICDSISHYLRWSGRPRYKKSRLLFYK